MQFPARKKLFLSSTSARRTLRPPTQLSVKRYRGLFTGVKATVASKLTFHPIHCVDKNAWSYIFTYSLVAIVWFFVKYRSNVLLKEMRRPVGRPELWTKVGRKLRDQTSTFTFLTNELRVHKLYHNSKCFDAGTGIANNKRLVLFPVCHTSNILSLCLLHFPAIDFYDCRS